MGEWSPLKVWPTYPVHGNLLPTGKVLFWTEGDIPTLWDPVGDTFVAELQVGYDINCAGFAFLADGRLLVAGGHISESVGLPHASIYDPFTRQWTRLPDMNDARWYPSATTLPNGDILVTSGDITVGNRNNLHQVWQAAEESWRDLTSAELQLPLYPWTFVAPNGKVFVAGWTRPTRYLDTSGTGAWTFVANSNLALRDFGGAVMYQPGKVLIVGGADPPVASAEVIDLSDSVPAWRTVAPMSSVRRQHNATLLPDGTVLVTGGSSGAGFNNESQPVFFAELWDPVSEAWTPLAGNSIYRGYHSIALLLPDGRVLTAGGINNNYKNAEMYSPPYLFKGPRPSITTARSSVGYNRQFFVGTPDSAGIARATWVRLSSATHGFNMNQRFNELIFTPAPGGLTVTTPANSALAPPGHYLLFLLNGQGVPSVAHILRIDAASSAPPLAPSSLTATAPTTSQVDLAWTDTADNEEGYLVERSLDGVVFVEIANLSANSTGYTDLGLSPATPYDYRVRTYNFVADSAFSNTASVTTPGVPVASLSSEALNFGEVFLNSPSPAQAVTLSNEGTGALSIETILSSGDFAQVHDCAAALAPGANCAIQVTFTPTALGLRTGSLSIFHDAAGSPHTVSLSGSGINPLPALEVIEPMSADAGGAAFTLTVTGSGFVAASVVRWNGSDRATTHIGSTELRATIAGADIAAGGTAEVIVFTPAPGGGVSDPMTFTINNPAPAVASLDPMSAEVGGADFLLTVTGSGFVADSVVQWNGSNRATLVVSPAELTAAILAGDIAAEGTAEITVFNPAPGGGASNVLSFAVVQPNPVPALQSLDPPDTLVGGGDFTLVVRGNGFVPGAVVRWNGSDRTTNYAGDTELAAAIAAADIGAAETASVTVFNPAPGGGLSNAMTFTINNPAPVLAALDPMSADAGSAAFTLTVTGSGFVAASVVRWNGSDRATTHIGSTELRATIAAADIAVGGAAEVAVFTPGPGGGATSALPLAIDSFEVGIPEGSPTTVTVPAGQSAHFTFVVTPTGSYDQAATFSCAGLPPLSGCSFDPAQVTPGSQPATVMLTLRTTGPAAAAAAAGAGPGPWFSVWLLGTLGLLLLPGWKRRRGGRAATVVLLAVALAALAGCGGGGGAVSSPPTPPRTPAGAYPVTVTAASGNFSQALVVTVVVQ